MDYGRVVGDNTDLFLSFQLGMTGGGFSDTPYGYNSIKGVDLGWSDHDRWMEDINGDGYLDYCRYVGDAPNIKASALLGTSTGFDSNQYYDIPAK